MGELTVLGGADLTRERFTAILSGSPAAGEAGAMYGALVHDGIRPAVFLGFFWVESRFGAEGIAAQYQTHNPGNVRSPERAELASGSVTTPRGVFAVYRSWLDGAEDWAARMAGPKYAGRGLLTLDQILPVYAPGSDSNDPAAYAATVAAKVAEWTKGGSPVGHVPKPPIDDLINQTTRNKIGGVGFDWMSSPRLPGATVLHSMAGTLESCINYFPLPTTAALTDFGIGNAQDSRHPGFARIVQFNDIRGTREGWASGPVGPSKDNPYGRPQGDGPRWLAHIGGAGAVNEVGVSCEHDDTTRADGTVGPIAAAPASVYQWASSVWLQAWLHAEQFVEPQTADSYDWNLWHCEIVGDVYKRCPQDRIRDFVDDYQAAVKAIMRHFQEGAPYPSGGLVIAGMRIATPPEGGAATKVPVETQKGGTVDQEAQNQQLLKAQIAADYQGDEGARYLGDVMREGRLLAAKAGIAGGTDAERVIVYRKNAFHTLGGHVYSFFSDAAAKVDPSLAAVTFGALLDKGLIVLY